MQPPRITFKPKSEMNVVPYIDVMLVLLVIFMVTAPMLTQGIQVELPEVAAETLDESDPQSIVTLSIDVEGQFHWRQGDTVETDNYSDSTVSLDKMVGRITAVVHAEPATQVFIRADRDVGYGQVASAIGALQKGGITRLGLITEAP